MPKLIGLVITKPALDNLKRIPFKIRAQLIKKAKALILNPHPSGSKLDERATTEKAKSF